MIFCNAKCVRLNVERKLCSLFFIEQIEMLRPPSWQQKLPKHLNKGGNIPLSISPVYYYCRDSSRLKPFQTFQKQPRTLKYSLNFDPRSQLETEYPALPLSVLDCDHQSAELANLRFPQHHLSSDEMVDETYDILSSMLNPLTMYQTTRKMSASRWEFGGHAYEFGEIPSAGDMTLGDSFSEVCLSGQSNAGKSSLVNVIMGSADWHKGLAVVSKKPGRTRVKS